MIRSPCYVERPETGIIQKLEDSKFNFWKTGSRFFNTATSKSDYDFFTEFNSDVLLFLEGLGFEQLFNFNDAPEYDDPSVHSVFRTFNYRSQIDVQLVDPDWMDLKILAHEVILKNYWFIQDKETLKKIWAAVLRTLRFLKIYKHLTGQRSGQEN